MVLGISLEAPTYKYEFIQYFKAFTVVKRLDPHIPTFNYQLGVLLFYFSSILPLPLRLFNSHRQDYFFFKCLEYIYIYISINISVLNLFIILYTPSIHQIYTNHHRRKISSTIVSGFLSTAKHAPWQIQNNILYFVCLQKKRVYVEINGKVMKFGHWQRGDCGVSVQLTRLQQGRNLTCPSSRLPQFSAVGPVFP